MLRGDGQTHTHTHTKYFKNSWALFCRAIVRALSIKFASNYDFVVIVFVIAIILFQTLTIDVNVKFANEFILKRSLVFARLFIVCCTITAVDSE